MSQELIERFYAAFDRKDGEAMAACYHPDAVFSDPVFPRLDAREVGAMWRMFCSTPGGDLAVEFRDVAADDREGRAHWDARYTFSATGRKVLNQIDAAFEFRDGLIVKHTDTFDLWKWTRMALGPVGVVLGWSPIVRNKVRGQARKLLEKYMRDHPAKSA